MSKKAAVILTSGSDPSKVSRFCIERLTHGDMCGASREIIAMIINGEAKQDRY